MPNILPNILKDSNGRFNKKNILPLIGASVASTLTAFSAAGAAHGFLTHPSLSDHPHWRNESYGEFLATHIPLTITCLSILSLYTYFPIGNIRKNKQIENLKATSEPSSCVYNALVNDIAEEQSVESQL